MIKLIRYMNQEGNVCYRCKNVEDIYEYQKKKNTF